MGTKRGRGRWRERDRKVRTGFVLVVTRGQRMELTPTRLVSTRSDSSRVGSRS